MYEVGNHIHISIQGQIDITSIYLSFYHIHISIYGQIDITSIYPSIYHINISIQGQIDITSIYLSIYHILIFQSRDRQPKLLSVYLTFSYFNLGIDRHNFYLSIYHIHISIKGQIAQTSIYLSLSIYISTLLIFQSMDR